jgi:hypothetical protein
MKMGLVVSLGVGLLFALDQLFHLSVAASSDLMRSDTPHPPV